MFVRCAKNVMYYLEIKEFIHTFALSYPVWQEYESNVYTYFVERYYYSTIEG